MQDHSRDGRSYPKMQNLGPKVQQAMDQQTRIGWRHFIRGRLTMTWGKIIRNYMMENNNKDTSKQWCIKLVKINWTHVLQMWEQRNHGVHDETPEQQNMKKKVEMIEELQEIQQDNTEMAPSARALINIETERIHKMNNQLETFLYGERIVAKVY
jgi:hypothetical protein